VVINLGASQASLAMAELYLLGMFNQINKIFKRLKKIILLCGVFLTYSLKEQG